ncbi:MAG: hypothetical protein ABSD44_04390 [Terracidiphilus sp.]
MRVAASGCKDASPLLEAMAVFSRRLRLARARQAEASLVSLDPSTAPPVE